LEARTLLEENLVLYRTQDGRVTALEDLCPHRFLPLSHGSLNGDTLQCGYHGLEFDCTGTCTRVPGQDIDKGPRISVRHFPAHENLGLVWIWMGAPEKADTSKVFDLPQYHDDGWTSVEGDALHISANYLSLADNLCDPAHVTYVHPSTLGVPEGEDVPVTSEKTDYGLLTTRWLIDVPPIPLFKKFFDFKGNTDRWQMYHYYAPSISVVDFGAADTGAGAPEGKRDNCVQFYACHFLSPVDQSHSIDYWLHVKNFTPESDEVNDQLSAEFRLAFDEDKEILEAIQVAEQKYSDRRQIRLGIDQGTMRMRKMVDDMIKQEQHA
jgi:vanillate O-demethylase monooxygenase subunit